MRLPLGMEMWWESESLLAEDLCKKKMPKYDVYSDLNVENHYNTPRWKVNMPSGGTVVLLAKCFDLNRMKLPSEFSLLACKNLWISSKL